MFGLLRDKVLKGDAALPPSTDHAFKVLADILNTLWRRVRGWIEGGLEEQKEAQKIVEAVKVLTDILPNQRWTLEVLCETWERWEAERDG